MFLHAVDTGLQDEATRTRLRPLLQNPDVQDEDLIQQMNEIVLEEIERKSKLGSSTRHKNPTVDEVHALQTGEGAVQPATTDKKLKRPEGGNTKEDNFMAAIQEVRSELATLKESIEKNRTEDQRLTSTPLGSQNQQWYRRPMGCSSCQAKGRGESCDHCQICGSSDHCARGCRKKNSSGEKAGSGNRHGLRPRDRKSPLSRKLPEKSQKCVCCQRVAGKDQVSKQCSGCKAVRYCGQKCLKFHWGSHKSLCEAIEHLEKQKRSRVEHGDGYVFASHLTPKQHVAVANLVGKKCKVSCVLNGVPVEALWDTGAQVSIASKSWLGEYLPSL